MNYSICMHYTDSKHIPNTNDNVKRLPRWQKQPDNGGHDLNDANGSCGQRQRSREHTKKEDKKRHCP